MKAKIPSSKYRGQSKRIQGKETEKKGRKLEAFSGLFCLSVFLCDMKHGSKKPYVSHKKDWTMAVGYDWKQTLK